MFQVCPFSSSSLLPSVLHKVLHTELQIASKHLNGKKQKTVVMSDFLVLFQLEQRTFSRATLTGPPFFHLRPDSFHLVQIQGWWEQLKAKWESVLEVCHLTLSTLEKENTKQHFKNNQKCPVLSGMNEGILIKDSVCQQTLDVHYTMLPLSQCCWRLHGKYSFSYNFIKNTAMTKNNL